MAISPPGARVRGVNPRPHSLTPPAATPISPLLFDGAVGGMAQASQRDRPLSPHLQVWRWHVTLVASIAHRLAGMALYAGAVILTFWALALAEGPDSYAAAMRLLGSPLGKVVLFLLTVAVLFHLTNGVRHLFWDVGKGFEPKTADATAVIALVFGVAGAMAVWLAAAAMRAL
jgi:succinate dehydrogenase / fumarate reductase cytochrome b subunit